ncbi:MAG: hypothetical protein KJO79_02845, partial [Verrucomicrobiae bacterium]|nr:hypothetical protein [Verrucomicrobiae bacterium]NNJ86093.1 hypothetical protein [Akkermansiaceae bacterium]
LQLINNGNGGASTYDFWHYAYWWGSSSSASSGKFGDLTSFKETPQKDAPALHQIGAKMLWLDESSNEANNAPIRIKLWQNNHTVYHQAPIAHWNVRPCIATRSPSSSCSSEWYTTSLGAWMLQFAPSSPQDANDMPSLNSSNTAFTKSPFGPALNFSSVPEAVMFDVPHRDYGTLSIGSLRHAQISPYSWHPTYVVGHSLADIHSPYEASANLSLASTYGGSEKSGWDAAIGGTSPYPLAYGPRTWQVNSAGLLQVGSGAVTKPVAGGSATSRDEILAYDIAFEVNQNLWDRYFFSGIPMASNGSNFSWNPSRDALWNKRYRRNSMAKLSDADIASKLEDNSGLSYGFWNNAYLLKNLAAFNVNSTSVEAWTAFLSGLQGLERPTTKSSTGGGTDSVFSRIVQPMGSATSGGVSVDNRGGWSGGRTLSADEIRSLAGQIVIEVKERGPFVSLADFINRRLAPKSNAASSMGTLEAAIARAQLNDNIEADGLFHTTSNNANDNNLASWRVDLDKQPKSKAWGIPGYLTQGDLLEPLAPAMTVRGDSFLIRAYGESRDEQGNVKARAYLEAVVERTPDYVNPANIDDASPAAATNKATESALRIDPATGAIQAGNLSGANKKFGRRFVIKTFRWLAADEI